MFLNILNSFSSDNKMESPIMFETSNASSNILDSFLLLKGILFSLLIFSVCKYNSNEIKFLLLL